MSDNLSVDWCISNLSRFSNNAEFATLAKKVVLFLTPISDETVASLEAAGENTVTYLPCSGEPPSVTALCKSLRALDGKLFDRIFMDMREIDISDFAGQSVSFFASLKKVLRSNGAMFFTLKVGQNDRVFDVQNMFVLSDDTWLPGRNYLFDNILKDWAFRTMESEGSVATETDLLLLRLVPQKPSLLLICGKSMSGKTTLARELTTLNPHMHVSNDFIYTQLVRAVKNGEGENLHPELVAHLGDGSGQSCGNFNRALESVPGLMEHYLPHLIDCIPDTLNLVSIDFDLRTNEGIKYTRDFLAKNGFSVWLVERE
jgi:hypothetical protein